MTQGQSFPVSQQEIAALIGSLQLENMGLRRALAEAQTEIAELNKKAEEKTHEMESK
tara:strand:- start:1406 stop:1576 length:171 start_codon:yes stop_codon:yes gene_type:complete